MAEIEHQVHGDVHQVTRFIDAQDHGRVKIAAAAGAAAAARKVQQETKINVSATAQEPRRIIDHLATLASVKVDLVPPVNHSDVLELRTRIKGPNLVRWPSLPVGLDPYSVSGGKGKQTTRGDRKRAQVENFHQLAAPIIKALARKHRGVITVVDFGSGSGALLLPLAALFPHCAFVAVDTKAKALEILQMRANESGLDNVTTWTGMIQDYQGACDLSVSLHGCGAASDYAIEAAIERGSPYLVSPCCLGKINVSIAEASVERSSSSMTKEYTPTEANPDAFRYTSINVNARFLCPDCGRTYRNEESFARHKALPVSNPARKARICSSETQCEGTQQLLRARAGIRQSSGGDGESGGELLRPRSNWLRSQISADTYKCLAVTADRSEVLLKGAAKGGDEGLAMVEAMGQSRWAKTVLELDRNLAAEESGYSTCVAAMRGLEGYAKDDLLVGLPPEFCCRMSAIGLV